MKKLVVLAVVAQIILLTLTKFTAWPEMLAWPYLIIKGWLPYRDIAIAHTPFLVLDLAIFYKIFGVGAIQLKIYGWLLILLIDGTLFYIAKKLWGLKTAALTLILFVPLQFFYEGNGLWFDYALTFFGLMTFYAILTKKYAWAGIFWILGFFTKQTAFWFLFPAGLLLLGEPSAKIKRVLLGILGVSAFGVLAFWFYGILPQFYFWAIKFGIGILPNAAGQVSPPGLREALIAFLPFSILALALFLDWKRYLVLALWAFFGILGAFPRWELFHFQPGLPFLAMALAMFILERRRLGRIAAFLLVLYLVGLAALAGKTIMRNWRQPDRFLEPSVLKTAEYIKKNTQPNDKIFILNSWDSLYALSDRLPSSKPLIPQLSWYFSQPKVEESVVNSLRMDPPALVVMSLYSQGGLSSYKPKLLTDYLFKYYEITDSINNNFFVLTPNR